MIYLPKSMGEYIFPVVKNPPANAGDLGDSALMPAREDPLEEETATCSSILARKIPWTEQSGRL